MLDFCVCGGIIVSESKIAFKNKEVHIMNDLMELKVWLEQRIDDEDAKYQFADDNGYKDIRMAALAQKLTYKATLRKVNFLISKH